MKSKVFKIHDYDIENLAEQVVTALEHLERNGIYSEENFEEDLHYLLGVADTLPNPQCMRSIISKIRCLQNLAWQLAAVGSYQK
jgi:hypothetical protein